MTEEKIVDVKRNFQVLLKGTVVDEFSCSVSSDISLRKLARSVAAAVMINEEDYSTIIVDRTKYSKNNLQQ